MTSVSQYQNSGSELLEQPCHVIWLNAENEEDELAIRALIKRAGFGGITGLHSFEERGEVIPGLEKFPKTFIFRIPDYPK